MDNTSLAVQFFLQLAVVLVACRAVGVVAARFGQPQVVAEMLTGVLLGPSLLGWIAPDLQSWLFPWDQSQQTRDTQSYLVPASQLGLALYMFTVGLTFRTAEITRNLKPAIAVSVAGMAAPFALGAAAAAAFYHRTDTPLFGPGVSLPAAALFLGACLSITAFPMLARIIQFKGLTGTRMGTVAIAAGAIDDATAWALLAVVIATIESDASIAATTIGGGAAFSAFTLLVLRPALARFPHLLVRGGSLTESGTVVALALLAAGAWFTHLIHLHAVFGAFLVGAAMPRGPVTRDLVERIQPLTVALLLPLFFTYSGLNTDLALLAAPGVWLPAATLLVAAVAGKGLACYLAARATGIPHRESLGIGTLMNARGLMELIIINIGLQKGVITEATFAALVVVAIVTTLVASPVFDRLFPSTPDRRNPGFDSRRRPTSGNHPTPQPDPHSQA